MLIETRVFNKATGKMVYMKPLKCAGDSIQALPIDEGLSIELHKDDPIMLKTPILDADKKHLWEADICDCGVVTSYGLVRERGVVVWRADLNQFTININKSYEGSSQFEVVEARGIGNIYENPELMSAKEAYGKTN